MIINEKEIKGITDILTILTDAEVLSLSATVTHGLLKHKVSNRTEATEAILRYSTDANSFLKRKLITRSNLFDYLNKNSVVVNLPASKEDLVQQTLTYWNSKLQLENSSNASEAPTSSINGSQNEIYVGEISTMGVKFSEWFYGLLNGKEPIGVEHFYPDASLQLSLVNNEMTLNESVDNDSAEVGKLLFKTKQEHSLFFNPNLSTEGTKASMDSHGLVVIVSCGTLHSHNNVIGVFEQKFALARDPSSDNNWKIKKSYLVLRSKSNVAQLPTLNDVNEGPLCIT